MVLDITLRFFKVKEVRNTMSDSNINPMGSIYKAFKEILENMTIKYAYKAEELETLEITKSANDYIDAITKRDTFFTYIDYTRKDYLSVGITNDETINEALNGNTEVILPRYRDQLLEIRRQRVIDNFEEKNNYYRMLNGLPDIEDNDYYYCSTELVTEYGFDDTVPIHALQDHYNKISDGLGDYYISIIEGTGYIDELIAEHPDKTYLKYIGSNRISLVAARNAKNFQILQLKEGKIKHSLYDHFLQVYEQCREYFVKTIFIRQYREIIEYYDNFIAMCIFLMTIQQLIMRQLSQGIKREYFDIFAVKALYQAYNIPFNLNIDEETQNVIIRNLNLMIQNKATNKVIYNIAELLGFTNLNVYKYYLSKEHKSDIYGIPIEKEIEKFNSDTGEVKVGPDYQAMFDVYFQKAELKNDDFVKSFQNSVNRVDYEDVVTEDPFWWEDQNIVKQVWETEYNFVESKYLSLGISYSMTDMMFENIILLKMIMQKSKDIDDVRITLPRITGNTPIALFDVIVLLIALTACKHNLIGEIITIPTQVIHVLDYMQNVEQGDMLVDTLAFDFSYFATENEEGREHIAQMKEVLGEEEFEKFMSYISVLSIDPDATPADKIAAINNIYANIKGLYKFLVYEMTRTEDRETYTVLKTMYHAAFYSKELRDVFTITGKYTGVQRTAWTYFEFLYHRNPKLYNAIFEHDGQEQYRNYLKEHELKETDFSYEEFLIKVELGEEKINYDHLIGEIVEDVSVKDEKIYYYVNHIISRLEMYIDDLQYMYLINDTMTPVADLLLKLVRFFKSYTVDIIGMDIIYICDMKPENLLRLFDEIWYIEKWICPDERLEISYSDVIHRIESQFQYNELMKLRDQLYYNVYLYIDGKHGMINNLNLRDTLTINKEIPADEKTGFYETLIPNCTIHPNDRLSFKEGGYSDRIVKLWYSDDSDEEIPTEEDEEET